MDFQCTYPLESPARGAGFNEYYDNPSTPHTPNNLITQDTPPPDSPWWVTKLVTSVSGYLLSDDTNKENKDSNTISI